MTNIITREQGNLYIVLHALLASSKYTTTHLLRKYDKNYTYFKPCIHEEHNTPSGYGLLRRTCFNPRAREERDNRPHTTKPTTTSFNPHAREERDHRRSKTGTQQPRFNPRAREERDLFQIRQCVGSLC